MLTIRYQTAFKKDFKRIKKRGYDISLLENVIEKDIEINVSCEGFNIVKISITGNLSDDYSNLKK